jgi:endonuclease YncB( thermonuclease family)
MYEYKAKIIRILDSDTFETEISLGFGVGFTTKLRLKDFDGPETWRPRNEAERIHGQAATDFVRAFIGDNEYVTIKTEKTGKYGRYIASVEVNGNDLREELIAEGFEKREVY